MLTTTVSRAFPLLFNKTIFSQPLIYLCRNYTCQSPTNNVDTIITIDQILKNQLKLIEVTIIKLFSRFIIITDFV